MNDEQLIQVLNTVVWYNGYEEDLKQIKEEISQLSPDKYSYHYDYGDDMGMEIIWMILVLLFGEYGTSPRSGWLEVKNKDDIISFIDQLCEGHIEIGGK